MSIRPSWYEKIKTNWTNLWQTGHRSNDLVSKSKDIAVEGSAMQSQVEDFALPHIQVTPQLKNQTINNDYQCTELSEHEDVLSLPEQVWR